MRIERVHPNAFTDCADNDIIRYDRPDMAVLAIAAADFIGRRNHPGPDCGRRAWMRLFIDYIAAKWVIAPALKSLIGGGSAH